ncbi:hypothetical protein N431DRAFT_13989 [Stipitochalara longipes BDJ]|nr:hypothetical protein N431DRAFT_13989 [Stipitochalara longipes BDJ]
MTATPSPQHSPYTSKTFYSASYFHRPSMTRKNAYKGKPSEPGRQPEPADILMTGTEDFALPEPTAGAPVPAQGIIDVSAPKEERPKKRLRLASVPYIVRKFRKLCFSPCLKGIVYYVKKKMNSP